MSEATTAGAKPLAFATGASKGIGCEALVAGKDEVAAASLVTRLEGVTGAVLSGTAKAARHARQSAPGSAG